jgi:Tfp pilus assembly protein PilZ
MKKIIPGGLKNRDQRPSAGREQSLRFSPRSPASGLVRINSSGKEYSGYLVNIGHEGLMTRARYLPEPEEKITLIFRLLPSGYELHLQAIVIWSEHLSKSDWFKSMGVRFIDLDGKDRKQIKKHVRRFS